MRMHMHGVVPVLVVVQVVTVEVCQECSEYYENQQYSRKMVKFYEYW